MNSDFMEHIHLGLSLNVDYDNKTITSTFIINLIFSPPFTSDSLQLMALSCTYHGLLGIFVVRVPTNAHHHFVDIPIAHTGPAVVDSCADICWKIVHH